MSSDSGVKDRVVPGRTAPGGGGRRRIRGGGGRGTLGGQGGAGNPPGADLSRLIEMLERMRRSLNLVVHITSPVVDQTLHAWFVRTWPEVNEQFDRAIAYLRRPVPATLLVALSEAGLTGEMLQMKQASLYFHLDRLDTAIRERPIITAPLSERVSGLERIVKWFKPSAKTINSILGSLPKSIPGVDVAKEFKEHVEAAWDIVETRQEGEFERSEI